MSNASRDYSSPYKNCPHKRGAASAKPTRKKQLTWTMRQMGDSGDANQKIQGSNLAEALRIYADANSCSSKGKREIIYVKILGERFIRCVHPEGQIEMMPW